MSAAGAARAGSADLARLDELAAEQGIELERDVSLAPLTTLRVGGPADRLVLARSREALVGALRLARASGIPWFVLGNGSDLVVADAGIRGLVIRNRSRAVSVEGATLRADAGSHEGEMRDVLTSVEVWDAETDAERALAGEDCAFAYRESRFKHSPEIVLAASLGLAAGDAAEIAKRVDEHQAQRRATQPLADQNAGSVFRNPPGDHAGRLIEAAGLKGFRIGTASVSTLHANFIVTDRGGRATDVRALGDHVRETVAARFGVTLTYEIEFVGAWGEEADR